MQTFHLACLVQSTKIVHTIPMLNSIINQFNVQEMHYINMHYLMPQTVEIQIVGHSQWQTRKA